MTQSPFTLDVLPGHDAPPGAMDSSEYELPPLPYDKSALDGFLSAELLELHHDQHHRKYVDGLNQALVRLAEARRNDDFEPIRALSRAVAFNGSGHVLHTLYWHSMSPQGGGDPAGDLKKALEASFGSVDGFRRHFAAATKKVEGGGWGCLVYEPFGRRLLINAFESHQNMAFHGTTPLLVCDVWEHAYYLDYRNRRTEYVDRFLDVVHWDLAARRLEEVVGAGRAR